MKTLLYLIYFSFLPKADPLSPDYGVRRMRYALKYWKGVVLLFGRWVKVAALIYGDSNSYTLEEESF